MNKYFITGIGTDVGKTVASAIVTEALEADYWKPVQAGELQRTDTHSVMDLLSNSNSKAHDHSYALKTPMSPHAAAEIDKIEIDIDKIIEPKTENHLVIEGAGGLLVPLNSQDTIIDLIKKEYKIILVSRHYLGSINHTLLSINELRRRGLTISGIIFNGNEHPTTEHIIKEIGKVEVIGRINEENVLNKTVIKRYANLFKSRLETI
ncbi:dethiobiotin synthase [Lutimonas zeaxanthinifaciens]|uniref:dethiobiotin synthase n=1 Tax=Lutimonas zeaxanthinifaciens TaxID=3060215 RepID=UPI00265CA8A6|nr:dethiobiotin synthase [Lutimonas sp. YSD2104]WKK65287.1 dethiobiotin synthase [Lutimonas sp. YSD2104]